MKAIIAALFLLPSLALADVRVIKVRSSAETGPRTLRECVEASGPRICVFEISGRIDHEVPLRIRNGDLRIAGETAPGPVLITGASVSVEAPNVHLSHLEIRAADGYTTQKLTDRDSLKILAPARNVLIDHCSISWGVDENFSTYGSVSDITVRDSIISEGLRHSGHPEGGTKGHSMGALVGVGARNVRFVRNLFASNNDRNVRWREDSTGQVVSSLFYNWGGSTSWNVNNVSNPASKPRILLDFIGNHYVPGPNSVANAYSFFAQDGITPAGSRYHIRDVIGPRGTDWATSNLPKSTYGSDAPLLPLLETPMPVSAVKEHVLAHAGSRPWDRNPIDARVIQSVRDNTGRMIDCIDACVTGDIEAPGGYGPRPFVYHDLSVAETMTDADLETWLAPYSVGNSTPVATSTPAATATAIATSTSVATPTGTPAFTPTSIPTATAAPGATVTATPTKSPTPLVVLDTSDGQFRARYKGQTVLRFTATGRLYVREEPADMDTMTGAAVRDALRTAVAR